MRVLFCKIHCPPICFCKPSSHFYTPSPLKLENTPHAPPPPPPPPPTPPLPPSPEANSLVEGQADANGYENGNVNGNCNGSVNHLKSSLRKPSPESSFVERKKVKWVDVLGKELAEIKEFESSEDEGPNYGGMDNRGCVCTIL